MGDTGSAACLEATPALAQPRFMAIALNQLGEHWPHATNWTPHARSTRRLPNDIATRLDERLPGNRRVAAAGRYGEPLSPKSESV